MELDNKTLELNALIKNSIFYRNFLEKKKALFDNGEVFAEYRRFVDLHMQVRDKELNNQEMSEHDEKQISGILGDLMIRKEIREYLNAKNILLEKLQAVENNILDGLDVDMY